MKIVDSTNKIRITFKKHPRETGLYAVGHPYQGSDIKLNGHVIGIIHPPSWIKDSWSAGFTITSKSENCSWKWIFLKKETETEEECKQLIKQFFLSEYHKKYTFVSIDDD